ncbi:MAG TPA: GWxTD domain-containing protein, partial [Chitinophagaceae bacterium]|nr:GWxTD domain-containing protein [Chitinophagaceae bacterium]
SLLDYPFYDTSDQVLYFAYAITPDKDFLPSVYLDLKIVPASRNNTRVMMEKKVNLSGGKLNGTDSMVFARQWMRSGNYVLKATLLNDEQVVAREAVSFQFLNQQWVPEKPSENNSFSDSLPKGNFTEKYPLPVLQKNVAALLPVARDEERQAVRDMTESTDKTLLQTFFYHFWKSRNNEYPEKAWNEYAAILNEVGKRFGSSSGPGYESDRGRVFIRYGEPDRIIRVPNEKNALPYEVWFYYKSGEKSNLKFLFYQPGISANQVFLLHSNVSGELKNPQWRYQLLQDPTNGDNSLIHKVFEFFKD